VTYQTLQVSVANYVARVELHRPDLHNAFNETMIAELTDSFLAFGSRTDVRAILLTATGKCFSAGADLNWMRKMSGFSDAENRADALALATMLRTIYACPKPVVAQIQGDAYGGGVGLIAATDIAIAAETARFSLSEVKLGLIAATISPYVIRAIGERAAHRYLITAERFDAQEAYRIGLVHQIVPKDKLEETVQSLLRALLQNSPNAVTESKRLVREVVDQPISDVLLEDTAQRIARVRASDEGKEGVRAFLEKRRPFWQESAARSQEPGGAPPMANKKSPGS
jgi:methylglutaconyl-CoA hydratase